MTGLMMGVPSGFAQYIWSPLGGPFALGVVIDSLVGVILACLAGAWVYQER